MNRYLCPLLAVLLSCFVFAGAQQVGEVVTLKGGLQLLDLIEGEGLDARRGDEVTVHYTGWLTNGEKFDSSKDRGRPFVFQLGKGRVIEGWDLGVVGMKTGGKRKLMIPAKLAYGKRGAGAAIPPDSDLVFEVELLKVKVQ